MDYTVDLSAQVGAITSDDDLGDRFLTALENYRHVLAPAVSQNTSTGILSATFCVAAADAYRAVTVAKEAFCTALKSAGGSESVDFTEIHVVLDREEAATAV